MTPFGTYRLVYEPPANTVEGGMEMNISSEANLDQMLDLFAAFLRASGYPIDFAAELVIQEEQPGNKYEDALNEYISGPATYWGGYNPDVITFS